MNRRVFLSALSAVGLAELMSGCGRAIPPLRIASQVWPGFEFMFLARREGWISPLDIVLVETGSATESMQLLADGKADGAALTLDEVMRARDRGLDLMAVLVFDVSVGADVLLVKPGITALEQLRGKRIGCEQSALGALMLHKVLEAASLRPSDVRTVAVTFDQHQQAWRSGALDALITFEPVSSRLQAEDASNLFDSSRIPDTIFDVLAVSPAAAARHPDALRRLVSAHFRGLENFRKNPDDTAFRMAERFQLPPKDVIGAYKGLELPNSSRNRKLLRAEGSIIVSAAKGLSVTLAQAGILKRQDANLGGLVSAEFIPRSETK